MNTLYTNLDISISILEDNYFNQEKEYRYFLEFSTSNNIKMNSLSLCNDFIKKYAFKYQEITTLNDTIKEIKNIILEAKEYDVRVDILFGNIDKNLLLTKELRNESDSRIIISSSGKSISYNRSLSEKERNFIYSEIENYISDNLKPSNEKSFFTKEEVEKLLNSQRSNCYVAILNKTRDEELAKLACLAPEPGGGKWREE